MPTAMTIDNIVPAKKTDGQIYDNNLNTPEVRIKEANQNLIPPLSISSYEQLKESIRENGLLVPIVVNRKELFRTEHIDTVHLEN